MLSALTNWLQPMPDRSRRARLGVEALEARDVPSYGVSLTDHVLHIEGARIVAFSDQINVSVQGTDVVVDWVEDPAFGHRITRFNQADVSRIEFYGFGGNDYFQNDTGVPCRAFGGMGNDTMLGGWANDELNGGSGYDRLEGWDGNDRLIGDVGNDQLYGEAGNDYLNGGDGYDALDGGDGADLMYGGWGNDRLDGGA